MIVHMATAPKVDMEVSTSKPARMATRPSMAAGANFLQNRRPDKSSYHGQTPVKRDVESRCFLRHRADVGLTEIVDEKAADGDFGADVQENGDDTKHQVALLPELDGSSAVGIFDGGGVFDGRDHRELVESDGDRQRYKNEGNQEIGETDSCGLMQAISLEGGGRQFPYLLYCQAGQC